MYLFDDFVKHSFWVVLFLADEDVSHALGNEIKRLAIVLVFIKVVGVIFEIDLRLSCLFLDLFEKEFSVLTCSFSDLFSNVNICDEGPGDEEIVQELFENVLSDDRGLRRDYHFERYLGLETVIFALENVHIFQEVMEVNLGRS